MTFNIKELRFDGEHGRDEFRRAQIADKVIRLLTSEIDVSPMVIDGAWGTGKTEFTHKLINRLKDQMPEHRAVYIDAFRADHADDPLMTILAEVATLIPEKEVQSFFDKAIPVIRYGIKATLKAGVSHLLRQNADDIAGDLEKNLEQAANDAIDASVRTMLKDHERAEQSLIALQKLLEDIAKDHPIVIFIDELDRCRPDYAVNVLEVIKHTFNVKGVSFVLITKISQLRAAINHQYGAVIDSQRYLDKFLKFRFELPSEVSGRAGYGEKRLLASVEHFAHLVASSDVLYETELNNTGRASFSFVSQLIRVNQLSLREVETFTRHLEIYHSLSNGLKSHIILGLQLLRLFGVFVFCFKHEVYDDIQSGCTDAKMIVELFGVTTLPEYEEYYSSLEHTVILGVLLAQRSASNTDLFIPNDKNIRECWKADFDRYFDGNGIPADVWKPVKEVFSVLSLSSGSR
ncbi:MAG: P-loop NTPase fold protein [Thalassolituus sp.]|uniref:KAP family P-loop NTPase fold protein n=1 Tax=Thalassolituus sp. TaxID=2030822 RepID=UPI00398206BA